MRIKNTLEIEPGMFKPPLGEIEQRVSRVEGKILCKFGEIRDISRPPPSKRLLTWK